MVYSRQITCVTEWCKNRTCQIPYWFPWACYSFYKSSYLIVIGHVRMMEVSYLNNCSSIIPKSPSQLLGRNPSIYVYVYTVYIIYIYIIYYIYIYILYIYIILNILYIYIYIYYIIYIILYIIYYIYHILYILYEENCVKKQMSIQAIQTYTSQIWRIFTWNSSY